MIRLVVFLGILSLGQFQLSAKITLPDILCSHMVLQQKMPVPIWGNADPKESIIISFKGQKKTITASDSGEWKVYLDPLSASFDPADLIIEGSNTIVLTDILVGEVLALCGTVKYAMDCATICSFR